MSEETLATIPTVPVLNKRSAELHFFLLDPWSELELEELDNVYSDI